MRNGAFSIRQATDFIRLMWSSGPLPLSFPSGESGDDTRQRHCDLENVLAVHKLIVPFLGFCAFLMSTLSPTAESKDSLLAENPNRYVLFPIQDNDIWTMYKKHMASFWTAEEIDLAGDLKDWDSLNDGERRFIKHVLAFFAASDGIVLENLAVRFMKEVQSPEARYVVGISARECTLV